MPLSLLDLPNSKNDPIIWIGSKWSLIQYGRQNSWSSYFSNPSILFSPNKLFFSLIAEHNLSVFPLISIPLRLVIISSLLTYSPKNKSCYSSTWLLHLLLSFIMSHKYFYRKGKSQINNIVMSFPCCAVYWYLENCTSGTPINHQNESLKILHTASDSELRNSVLEVEVTVGSLIHCLQPY